MSRVALISQPLRSGHCHAYIEDGEPGWTILTSDPSAFVGYEWAVPPHVVAATAPPELLPPTRLLANRIFRTVLDKARAGSRFGAWAERSIKVVVRRLRGSRVSVTPRRSADVETQSRSFRSSAMFLELEEVHRTSPIERIVVFDVFDLPVALAFAEDHEVDVLVR